MMIPEIKEGIISGLLGHENTLTREWFNNLKTRLEKEQPILTAYLISANDRFGEQAALTGLIVFRLIEAQLETEELESQDA